MTTAPILVIVAICLVGIVFSSLFKSSEEATQNSAKQADQNEIDQVVNAVTKESSVSAVTKVERSLDGQFIVSYLDYENKRHTAVYSL